MKLHCSLENTGMMRMPAQLAMVDYSPHFPTNGCAKDCNPTVSPGDAGHAACATENIQKK
jgi:hypothetical protein